MNPHLWVCKSTYIEKLLEDYNQKVKLLLQDKDWFFSLFFQLYAVIVLLVMTEVLDNFLGYKWGVHSRIILIQISKEDRFFQNDYIQRIIIMTEQGLFR